MRASADIFPARKRRFCMLFSIATGLMGSLIAAPARAADLDLPTDAKIVKLLKAKRLSSNFCATATPFDRIGLGSAERGSPYRCCPTDSSWSHYDGTVPRHAHATQAKERGPSGRLAR